MFKFQKNRIKIFIIIIFLLIGVIFFLYNRFYKSEEKVYSINNDFLLYGTNNEQNLINDNGIIKEENKNKIIIHIIGEVINEGVVEIDEGSRIIDAVNEAGGFTLDADTSKINLAYVLKDGQKVIIPSIYNEEEINVVSSDSGANVIEENSESNGSNNYLVNINNASKQELQTLPGIGESTAQKIINYREKNGDFFDIEDIKNVSGIGDSKFDSIKDLITV